MKNLAKAKTRTIFETASAVWEGGRGHRQIIVEAHPTYALLRLKGLRGKYAVSWSAMFTIAVRDKRDSERALKAAIKAKKVRRK